MAKSTKNTKSIETIKHTEASRRHIPTAEFQSVISAEQQMSIDTRKCTTDIHPNRASHLRQECTTFATGQRAKRVNC